MNSRHFILFALLFLAFNLCGQQIPQYTQTSLNYLSINPAVAGSKDCFDLKLGFRAQWVGLEGAPATASANAHARIGKDKKSFGGVGIAIENDKAGPFGYTGISAIGAYNFRVNKRYRMAFGLSLGTMQYRLDVASLELPQQGASIDNATKGAKPEFVFPVVSFGWWLYRNDRFYGVAIRNLAEQEVKSIGIDTKIRRHYILSAGRTIDIDDDLYFKPTVNLRYVASSRLSADINAMIDYKDKIAAGIGFRSEHGMAGLLKINAFKYVTIGYAYDFTLNRLRYGSRNTHEIILGVQACPRGGTKYAPCSAYD